MGTTMVAMSAIFCSSSKFPTLPWRKLWTTPAAWCKRCGGDWSCRSNVHLGLWNPTCCWWFRNPGSTHQLRLVVYPMIYQGFSHHPRWLFGIFSINCMLIWDMIWVFYCPKNQLLSKCMWREIIHLEVVCFFETVLDVQVYCISYIPEFLTLGNEFQCVFFH